MHKKTVIDFKELGQRQIFTQPLKELKTAEIAEVTAILQQVEKYQKEGYYVVGYVSYEAAPAFEERYQVHHSPLTSEYLAYFTVHSEVELADIPITYEQVDLAEKWQSQTTAQEYQTAIEQIHREIRQGNTYQVNYTIQLAETLTANSFAIYNRLVVEQNAAYNAYIEHDDFAVLSISPELFFETRGDKLITRPMKGTVARGLTTQEDLAQAAWLAQDSKNRAENMMIVDLLRNDMNKICRAPGVQVSQLCQVEQYSTVWQMTSTIEGKLEKNTDLAQIFEALFPCGSITGAPKISTMGIIKQVEKKARGVYCGTVGICLPDQNRIFNVAIRTLQLDAQQAIYGAGGGITWDSTWQSEYEEALQKSAVLYQKNPQFELITTGKITQGKLTFLEEHVERLREAARYFSFTFDRQKLIQSLEELCQGLSDNQDYRLKISLGKAGNLNFDWALLKPLAKNFLQAHLVEQKHSLQKPFTFFKTSYRPHINLKKQEQIYHNEKGQLLETSIGNLVLKMEGALYTPPVQLGLLNGIYRQHLLKSEQVTEKILTLADLEVAEKIYACNAVRGLYELSLEKKEN